MSSVPKRYVPKQLSKKDKKKQAKELKRSRKAYKKGKYYTRKKMKSFKSKVSPHIMKAKRIYGVKNISANSNLAKKTGCSINTLSKIVKKGQGAYFSSGSRPNQTGHSWGRARLASSITGGKAAAVDFKMLENGCKAGSKALKLAKSAKKRHGYGTRRVPKHKGGTGSLASLMVYQGKKSKENRDKLKSKNFTKGLNKRLLTTRPKTKKTYSIKLSTIKEGGKRKTKKNKYRRTKQKGRGIGNSKPIKLPTPPTKTKKSVKFSPNTKSPSSPKKNKTKKMFISRNKERQKAVTQYENKQQEMDLMDMILGKKSLEGGGKKMHEKILKFERGPGEKKYTAHIKDNKTGKIRVLHFGHKDYEQFKDRTKNGLYSSRNHGNKKRQRNYYNRHSGEKNRKKAIKKEKKNSKGYYTPKLLSHIYLW